MPNPLNLSARQARFVQEFLVDGNGTQAAIRAGYGVAGAGVAALRLLRNDYVQNALQTRQRADASRLSLAREDVLAGLLEAVAQAREHKNPMGMISGLREVGRLMGFYAPQVKRVELRDDRLVQQGRMEAMTDAELLALIDGGAAPG